MTKEQLRDEIVQLATEYASGFVILNLYVSHEQRKKIFERKLDELIEAQSTVLQS